MSQDAVLGHVFSNKALLEEALTTPSFKMTSPGARDNQRLEFLGDAVLGLLATDWLYANSPSEEGDMSARRQHMVSASALCAAVAGKGFVAMLKRNKGAGELPETAKTVADAVEAVMGAAWLDGGMAAAKGRHLLEFEAGGNSLATCNCLCNERNIANRYGGDDVYDTTPDSTEDDGEEMDELCPVHNVPYDECAHLRAAEYGAASALPA